MCCAQRRRGESVPLTMPRMSLKSDGRGAHRVPGWGGPSGGILTPSVNDCTGCRLPLDFIQGLREASAGLGENNPMMRLLLAAALVLPSVGCASVTRGTTENISI